MVPDTFIRSPRHIGDATLEGLFETLKGDLDQVVEPTRKVDGVGKLFVKDA